MSTTVFLVVQQAVYRHKIMGAYTRLSEAQLAIQNYITSELNTDQYQHDADGHHSYEICTIEANHPITNDTDATCVATLDVRQEETRFIWS